MRTGKYDDEMHEEARSLLADRCVDISDVASKFEIDKNQFVYQFKKKEGKTPKVFQADAFIELAKKVLQDPSKSVNDISNDFGFSNWRDFKRVFEVHTGYSPTQYREYLGVKLLKKVERLGVEKLSDSVVSKKSVCKKTQKKASSSKRDFNKASLSEKQSAELLPKSAQYYNSALLSVAGLQPALKLSVIKRKFKNVAKDMGVDLERLSQCVLEQINDIRSGKVDLESVLGNDLS